MTNNCYCPRGVYDMYRVGADPVKLNLYYRKRIRNRLFYKIFRGRLYWTGYDILHKIHEIYTTVIRKIHRTMRRIVRFAYKSVKVFYNCAMIAIL